MLENYYYHMLKYYDYHRLSTAEEKTKNIRNEKNTKLQRLQYELQRLQYELQRLQCYYAHAERKFCKEIEVSMIVYVCIYVSFGFSKCIYIWHDDKIVFLVHIFRFCWYTTLLLVHDITTALNNRPLSSSSSLSLSFFFYYLLFMLLTLFIVLHYYSILSFIILTVANNTLRLNSQEQNP